MRRTPSIYWLLIGLSFLAFALSTIQAPEEPSEPWKWPHEVVRDAVTMARYPTMTPLTPTSKYVVR